MGREQAIPLPSITAINNDRILMNDENTIEQQHSGKHKSSALPAGTAAPDFTLRSTPDQAVNLSDFRGQPVLLAFYPADWSPVCGDQMALYNEMLKEFHELGAELIRHFGGWRVVPRRIRARSQASFPPSGRL